MKYTTVSVALFALFSLAIFNSCNSSANKEEKAENDVEQAEKDLKKAQASEDSIKMKTYQDEEWIAFRNLSDTRIQENEDRIAGLKSDMKKSNKKVDEFYEKKIDKLDEENKRIKNKVSSYNGNQGNWESFKQEVNRDMEELGKSFNDFTVKNTK